MNLLLGTSNDHACRGAMLGLTPSPPVAASGWFRVGFLAWLVGFVAGCSGCSWRLLLCAWGGTSCIILKVDFLALRAVRPAHCACDQKPHVSHWTILEPSSARIASAFVIVRVCPGAIGRVWNKLVNNRPMYVNWTVRNTCYKTEHMEIQHGIELH